MTNESSSGMSKRWFIAALICAPFAMFSINAGFLSFSPLSFEGAGIMTLVIAALWAGFFAAAFAAKIKGLVGFAFGLWGFFALLAPLILLVDTVDMMLAPGF